MTLECCTEVILDRYGACCNNEARDERCEIDSKFCVARCSEMTLFFSLKETVDEESDLETRLSDFSRIRVGEAKDVEIRDSAWSDDMKAIVSETSGQGTEVDLLISDRHIMMAVSSLFSSFCLVRTETVSDWNRSHFFWIRIRHSSLEVTKSKHYFSF